MRVLPSPRATGGARRRALGRGSIMMEAIVVMFLIGLTVAMFTTSTTSALRAQRDQHGLDIASLAAHGQLEKVKSLPWDQVGFLATDPGYVTGDVTVPATGTPDPNRLTPRATVTIKGLAITLTSRITWQAPPTATSYGTKKIAVSAAWSYNGTPHTATFTETRTSQANEAAPTAIPSGFGTPAPVVPTPYSEPSPTAGGQGWDY